MFDQDFFPTPTQVIERMTEGINFAGKVVLEPSAGKGDIIDYLLNQGAEVICCEKHPDLAKIAATKARLLAPDFLGITSDQISHVQYIVMNPPFSEGAEHILHAYEIAPPGCRILALCNLSTVKNAYTGARKQLENIIEQYGRWDDWGDCFAQAERVTGVKVAFIDLTKPGESYASEFEGFFMEEDPEEEQVNGIMEYNVVRDLVNRYVAAIKLYDQQLSTGQQMNRLLAGFYGESLTFTCTEKGTPKLRNDFKKDLQKAGWKFIFNKMNMEKYATRGLRDDINKFVEQQTEVPFTMRNIYKMLEIVVGTASQRMDKALLEVFDKVTSHADENKYGLPGWKTNSHYLLTRKFIVPYICYQDKFDAQYRPRELRISSGRSEQMEDMIKALCYITGDDYNEMTQLYNVKASYGEWFDWTYFRCKGFKKGTMHFEFKDEEIWARFNQRIAKIKGYPLFEGKKQTAYQQRQTGRAQQKKASPKQGPAVKPNVLFTFENKRA